MILVADIGVYVIGNFFSFEIAFLTLKKDKYFLHLRTDREGVPLWLFFVSVDFAQIVAQGRRENYKTRHFFFQILTTLWHHNSKKKGYFDLSAIYCYL